MKVLIIGFSDFNGGAARATLWLAKGLRAEGVDVQMLVEQKITDHFWIHTYKKSLIDKIFTIIERKFISMIKNKDASHWSLNIFSNNNLYKKIVELSPDILNIHWAGNSFMPLKLVKKFKIPIFWSLYDMWLFTAGCHYDNFCEKHKIGCINCPQVNKSNLFLNYVYKLKYNSLKQSHLKIISPSRWLADQAYSSKICNDLNILIDIIPHGTDVNLYNNFNKISARQILNLPSNFRYLLFGSMSGIKDKRKGFQFLIPALKKMSKNNNFKDVRILVIGENAPKENIDLGFEITYLGRVVDDVTLKIIYCASDVTITPSMQEAFGMTASESMACGTPVVAFNISGAKDVIDHKKNGYLVEPFDVNDLTIGIEWTLNSIGDQLSEESRKKCVENFSLDIVSKQYIEIFKHQF